jgi:Peptidoglycan-synthase activator LpoB
MAPCFFQNRVLYAMDSSPLQKNRIAVLEISTNNIPPSFGNIARNNFEVFLFNSGSFQLLDRERQQSVAVKLGISPNSSNSLENLISFGLNISADYLVSGNIDKLDEYKITLRVISVKSGEIITVHTQSFSSIDEFDAAVNIVSVKIKNNLTEYVRDGKIQKPFFEQHSLSAGMHFNYFIPVSNFRDLINSGPGIKGTCEIGTIFFDNDYTGVHAGYYRFNGRKNNSDVARFIIIQASYGYRFNFSRWFYFKSEIESGINMITLRHGTDNGFNMAENSQKKAIDPIMQFGFSAGVAPYKFVTLETGVRYGINFETGGNLYFYNVSAGLTAHF